MPRAAERQKHVEVCATYLQRRTALDTPHPSWMTNHGRFQDLLSVEMEQVCRYHYPAGLIMLDIDDFKSVNDTYGHQQGDVVLTHVARALRESSREADTAARYRGSR